MSSGKIQAVSSAPCCRGWGREAKSKLRPCPQLLRPSETAPKRTAPAPTPDWFGSHLRQRQALWSLQPKGTRSSSGLSPLGAAFRNCSPRHDTMPRSLPKLAPAAGGHLKSHTIPRALPARFTSTLASAQRVTSGSSAIARDFMPGSRDSPGAGPSLSGTE